MRISDWSSDVCSSALLLLQALGTSGLLRLIRTPGGVSAEVGLLMASPSETTLIVLAAAQGARLIGPDTASFWQVVTAIGLTATPLLARLGRDVARRVDGRSDAGLEFLEQGHNGRTVIIGFGRVGRMVAQLLERHRKTFIAVDAAASTVPPPPRQRSHTFSGVCARPRS